MLSYTLHQGWLEPDRDTPRPGIKALPRLALIHSLALDRTVWNDVVQELEGEADILTYDCRGHGKSDRRAGRFTAELFADDLAELLDSIGWPDAVIAGCSMGGCVALAFGARYPARTRGLGLIDTTAWYGEGAAEKFRERAEAARARGMAGLIDFQKTRWFSDRFRAEHPEAVDRAAHVFIANDFDCYAASCGLLGDVDLRSHLPALRMPVAVVVGDEDYATPVEMSRALHTAIPQSTLTILPGGRHLTPIECPGAIASELRKLLQ